MANNADQQNNSDDLIAELARLMAEDAQTTPEAAQPKAAEAKAAEPKPLEPRTTAKESEPAPAASSGQGQVLPFAKDSPDRFATEQSFPNPPADAESEAAQAEGGEDAKFTPEMRPAHPDDEALAENLFARLAAQLNELERGRTEAVPPEGEAHGVASSLGSKTGDGMSGDEMSGQDSGDEDVPPQAEQYDAFEEPDDRDNTGQDEAEMPPSTATVDPIAALIAGTPGGGFDFVQADREPARPDDHDLDRTVNAPSQPLPSGAASARFAEDAPGAGRAAEVSPAPQSKRQDNFSVSPVFGLGSARAAKIAAAPAAAPSSPAASAPADAGPADPIDEIEALIGDAVRASRQPLGERNVGFSEPVTPAPEPHREPARAKSPSMPDPLESLNAEPRPAARRAEPDASLDLGADLPPRAASAPKRRMGLMVPAIGLVAVLVLGGAGYWLFGRGNAPTGEAPVLASNTEGAKVAANTKSTTDDGQQSVVFSELEKGKQTAPANEQLVSRDQSTTASGNATDTIRQVGEAAPDTATTNETTGLTNRKVRTVTVKPDGTIVSDDESLAGNQVLPVTRPNVPDIPGSDTTQDGEFTVASAQSGAAGTAAPPATVADTEGELVANAPAPAPPISAARRQELAAAVVATGAPAASTGSSQAVDLLANAANAATTAPAATSAPTATPSAGDVNAPAYVQLSSQRSLTDATTTLNRMKSQYGNLFGGSEAFVRQVDLADKGTFYRVLVPANSFDAATTMCTNIKTAGGDCFVRTN